MIWLVFGFMICLLAMFIGYLWGYDSGTANGKDVAFKALEDTWEAMYG